MKIRMKILSLTIPNNYKKLLHIISDKQGISISELVRNLIIQFVDYWVSQNGMEVE
jgi:hypothetical protein